MQNRLNPPTEAELDWLDDFLLNRIDDDTDVGDRDEGIIDLSSLDGFFTAVVSGPGMIPPSRWIPSVWGDFEPEWESQQAAEQALSLLMRYMNSVAAFLIKDPQNYEPLFMGHDDEEESVTIVDDWCEGYMRGVELDAASWQMDSMDMMILLAPIKFFTIDYGQESYDGFSHTELENLQKAITPNVLQIHAHWMQRRMPVQSQLASTPFRHDEPPVGRNDPCPCGSGKKYKKCCLH